VLLTTCRHAPYQAPYQAPHMALARKSNTLSELPGVSLHLAATQNDAQMEPIARRVTRSSIVASSTLNTVVRLTDRARARN